MDGSRQQVVGALVSQFPIDQAKLEHELPGLWAQWDADGSGIDRASFLDPDKGLLQYVQSRLLAEDLAPVAVARQRSPGTSSRRTGSPSSIRTTAASSRATSCCVRS